MTTSDSFVFPTFAACPGCGGPVRGELSSDLAVFVCVRCGTSWHVELGVVYEVDRAAPTGGSWPEEADASDPRSTDRDDRHV